MPDTFYLAKIDHQWVDDHPGFSPESPRTEAAAAAGPRGAGARGRGPPARARSARTARRRPAPRRGTDFRHGFPAFFSEIFQGTRTKQTSFNYIANLHFLPSDLDKHARRVLRRELKRPEVEASGGDLTSPTGG